MRQPTLQQIQAAEIVRVVWCVMGNRKYVADYPISNVQWYSNSGDHVMIAGQWFPLANNPTLAELREVRA